MSRDMIIGTWSLVKYTMHLIDGNREILYPYGENPIGVLIYTSHDVSVHIMRSNRSRESNPFKEQIECAVNYGGYVGPYEIRDDTIIHYPKVSSFVNFLQVPQIRSFKLQDDFLILEYTFVDKENGRKSQSQLVWHRVYR